MAAKLANWLGSLPADLLAEVLARRPDTLAPPAPRTLAELADRLQSRPSVGAAFHGLPLPAVQLIETLQACGGPAVARERLAASLGLSPDDPDLDATLQVLTLRALVWPDGEDLHMAGPLWSAFAHPLRLGPPAQRLLATRTADELRRVAAALGVPVGRTKQQVLTDLAAALTEGERVRAAVAAAPPEIGPELYEIAWHGPVVRHPEIIYGYGHSTHPVLDWALARGLLVADGWQAAVMPAEVGRALRGPDWHAPFTPQAPRPELVGTDPAAVAREAAATAGAAVAQVTAVLETCAAAPPAPLKAGGVGLRELRRVGKATGADEATTRLCLELAHASGLLGVTGQSVLPTDAYDAWRELQPAQRLLPLLRAWWRLPATPLADRSPDGEPPVAALSRTPFGDLIRDVRHALMHAAADLPDGRGLLDDAGLVDVLTWRAPLLVSTLDDPADLPTATWREARWLGLVGHGSLTPLGRALLADRGAGTQPAGDGPGGDPAAGGLGAVARQLLPDAVSTALFGADLTAVVPGTPAASLAALLDSAADRESAGGAVTWRFSPVSVRRALDAGQNADGLLGALSGAATGGKLPQPLEYLVGDVARRHGQVRVRTVACVIRGEDTALLAEMVALRALAPLRLALLAPTVVASRKPAAETLAALRAAGYAPVGEAPDGTAIVERVERRRAGKRREVSVPSARRPAPTAPEPADPLVLAAALLAGSRPAAAGATAKPTATKQTAAGAAAAKATGRRPDPGYDPRDTESVVGALAPQLSPGERRLLIHAIDNGRAVKIHYINAQGNRSDRVIEPLGLYGRVVEAWCRLREEERMFAIERIEAVAPA